MGQVAQYERDEDVVGVRRLPSRAERFEGRLGLGTHRLALVLGGQGPIACPGLGRVVAGFPRGEPGPHRELLFGVDVAVPPLQVPQPIARVSQEPALPCRWVEAQRRCLELVEDKHHRP